jgi:hypothetical protein
MRHPHLQPLVWALCASLSLASFPRLAQAELVGTETLARAEGVALRPADDARAFLAATLARQDVATRLRQQGVDPAQALARVQALTDAQAQALAKDIDEAPAGAGDVLGTIIFIFVLLLVTDILGFTKVFPFTRSIR